MKFAAVLPVLSSAILLLASCAQAGRDDWPMSGRDATRNSVSPGKNPPIEWSVKPGQERRVAWKARLGELSFSSPVVANGVVWAGTDHRGLGGVLMAFREEDGLLLGSHFTPWREHPELVDWSWLPVRSSPLVEGDRLWYVNNRSEVVCLDLRALRDGPAEPRELWKLDLIDKLGVTPSVPAMFINPLCSIGASYRGRLYVSTGHSPSWKTGKMEKPDSPTLICLDRETGELLGRDPPEIAAGSVGGSWSSPLALEVEGQGVLLFGGGDGFLYAFDPEPDPATKLLRKRWRVDGAAPLKRRLGIFSTPVVHGGRVYVLVGDGPDSGSSPGALTCVDVLSGRLLWQYRDVDASCSSPVVHEGVVYAVDTTGVVHALDAASGRLRWKYDMLSYTSSTPLLVDGRLYVGNGDGEMVILDVRDPAAQKPVVLHKIAFPDNLSGSPVYANGTLFVAGDRRLYAIRNDGQGGAVATEPLKRGRAPSALFVPTPHDVVEHMLDLAAVTGKDFVVDLGSGDGRIPIAAAQRHGCRARGVEIDLDLVRRSREAVERAGLKDRVGIEHENLLQAEFGSATVVTLYIGERLNGLLLPRLRLLRPGVRIVSHRFAIPGVPPDRTIKVVSREDGLERELHLWTTPLR